MSYIFSYLIYLFFGVLPSFLWLSFYLKKDHNPEPKLLLFKIFLYGGLITIPTIFIQKFTLNQIPISIFSSTLGFLIISLLLMAFIEEMAKFLVVKNKILKDPEFNEPIDAMIYMITAALGFAAAENFLVLIFSANQGLIENRFYIITEEIIWGSVFQISLVRFVGATFLHALCGAIIGFFIGLSFFKKRKNKLIVPAILLTTILHALYNFSIIKIKEGWSTFVPFSFLIALYLFVSFCFKKLRQLKK